jgi:hypothetical protein
LGLDVATFHDRAQVAIRACGPETPIGQNPGATLGAALGTLARGGRDKLTLTISPPLAPLGHWIEQLVAPTTGKEGVGILPVVDEPLGGPAVYGDDRVFVQVRLRDEPGVEDHPMLQALAEAGHPVIDLVLADPLDVAAEFFRWEFAVSLAARVLGVNPFEHPNLQESKDQTRELLNELRESGKLPRSELVASFEGLTVLDAPGHPRGDESASDRERFVAALRDHLGAVGPGGFVALSGFFTESDERDEAMQAIRTRIRDRLKVATTTGYGPRLLHSTGQYHRGGPNTGVFLQLTGHDGVDVPIPGLPFGFASLLEAQALADFRSLAARDRRVLRIHLGNIDQGLRRLAELIDEALPTGR